MAGFSPRATYSPGPNVMESLDPMGMADMTPTGPSERELIEFYRDLLSGQGNQYVPEMPGGLPEGEGDVGDPAQAFIRQQLAGDVVPMYGAGSVPSSVVQDRLSAPGAYVGSRGAGSINTFGGPESPYLDLLNILAFPTGRSMAPSIGRRR